jgi:hypothetical protein
MFLDMYQHFNILSERTKEYRRFNTVGTQLTVRLKPPSDSDNNPVDNFLASVNELFEYALQNVGDGDMIGFMIRNEINQKEKTFGLAFRRKDQIYGKVIWSVKFHVQCSGQTGDRSLFGQDALGIGRVAIKSKG